MKKIELKGNGTNIIIPLNTKEEKKWEELGDLEACV
jgi:hypothetical protein